MKNRKWFVVLLCAAWLGQGMTVFAEEEPMTVIRAYTGEGAKELFEIVAERKDELESVFRSVSGIISYTAVHTEEGGFTVTVCKNPAGISESVRLAREWVAKRAGHLKLSDPQIIEGFSLIHFTEQ